MPQIKISHVVSFSSEDPCFPANNLLSKDISNSKWIGDEKGASSNSVVLQLEKPSKITSIHIGNYHSGFIEVLVGRSESLTGVKKYEVLLVTSSFMNPKDSRNSVNISGVRTFTYEQLAEPVRDKNWDRIRIVCTQPFNRHIRYGLSFIHFFCSDSSESSKSENLQTTKQSNFLGKFKVRDEVDDDVEVSFKPGELFAKMKQKMSTDAQIRNAGSPHMLNKDSPSFLVKTSRPVTSQSSNSLDKTRDDIEPLSRKRDKIMYIDEDDEADEKIDSIIEKDRNEKAKIKEEQKAKNLASSSQKESKMSTFTSSSESPVRKTEDVKKNKNSQNEVNKERVNNGSISSNNQNKAHSSNQKRKNDSQESSSNKRLCSESNNASTSSNIIKGPDCLRGVVFVISGYVNPQRSNIRDTALSLGAKYRPDWDPTCTHLICAFPNTPKHQQVLRASTSAAVSTAEWIEECGKEKAHLPWQWFATDPKQRISRPPNFSLSNSNENDQEINNDDDLEDTDDEIEKVLKKKQFKTFKRKAILLEDSDATDIEDEPNNDRIVSQNKDEDSDKTDIEDVPKKNDDDSDKTDIEDMLNNTKNHQKIVDKYSLDTDSDREVFKKKPPLPSDEISLMDHFSGIKFYIDTDAMKGDEEKMLRRYVLAYGGDIVKAWPNDNIDVAITTEKHVHKLRPFKGKKCKFIKPEWVWQCNDESMLLSYRDYEIR